MNVSRFVPILASFVIGAAASWWFLQPAHPVATEKSRDVATLGARALEQSPLSGAPRERETSVGVPPETVTPAKPAPNAGQRRALARALDGLERNPPAIEARRVDETTNAAFIAGMRAAIENGATP